MALFNFLKKDKTVDNDRVNLYTPTPQTTAPVSAMSLLKKSEGMMPRERLEYLLFLQNGDTGAWTDHEKAYCCYLQAGAAKVLFGENNVSLAFYAAQLLYEPESDSAGWQAFIRYGFNPSVENAKRLHQGYPLPMSIEEAQNYSVAVIRNEEKTPEVPKQPEIPTKSAGRIAHIVCLCYDRPYTQQQKMEMQNHIINAETTKGSVITPTSRITFDSFYDNSNLNKPNAIHDKLTQIYTGVYDATSIKQRVEKTVAAGECKDDLGITYVKFFVLYE